MWMHDIKPDVMLNDDLFVARQTCYVGEEIFAVILKAFATSCANLELQPLIPFSDLEWEDACSHSPLVDCVKFPQFAENIARKQQRKEQETEEEKEHRAAERKAKYALDKQGPSYATNREVINAIARARCARCEVNKDRVKRGLQTDEEVKEAKAYKARKARENRARKKAAMPPQPAKDPKAEKKTAARKGYREKCEATTTPEQKQAHRSHLFLSFSAFSASLRRSSATSDLDILLSFSALAFAFFSWYMAAFLAFSFTAETAVIAKAKEAENKETDSDEEEETEDDEMSLAIRVSRFETRVWDEDPIIRP